MRILLTAGRCGDGTCGVADHTLFLAAQLAKTEQVGLMYKRGTRNLPAYEPSQGEASGLTLHPMDGFGAKYLKPLLARIAELKPDIVHLQYPAAEYRFSLLPLSLAGKRALFKGARFVVTLHEYHAAHPLRKLAADRIAKAADAVITPSAEDYEALQGRYGSKLHYIPDGEFFSLVDMKPETKRERKMQLIHFGLPSKTKDFPRMFSLYHSMRELLPGLTMKFVTPAGAETQLQKRYYTKGVEFMPTQPLGALRFLTESSLLAIFPFCFDTHRSSLINALSFRTPIMCFGVHSAVVRQFAPDLPFSLEPGDSAEKVAAFVIRLCEDFEDAAASRLAHQARLKARLSMARIAASHLSVYNSLA
jgi:hypothetical protein